MKTLAELFEGDPATAAYWENPYELHHILRWKPWQPHPCLVWAHRDQLTAGDLWNDSIAHWPMLRAQLLELHAEYLRRKGEV